MKYRKNKIWELAKQWNGQSAKRVPYKFVIWLIRQLEGENKIQNQECDNVIYCDYQCQRLKQLERALDIAIERLSNNYEILSGNKEALKSMIRKSLFEESEKQ